MNRHILIGRMKHLEKMGLVQSKYNGLWRVEKDAFKTLGQIEQREQLTKEIHDAMERANIKRPIRLDDGRENYDGSLSNHRIIGRVIAKTLGRDESMDADAKGGGKVRFIIDGTDGYISTVETGVDTRAGKAAKVGSIIEVSSPNLRTIDLNIQAIATSKDYHGKPHNGLVGNYAIATSGPEDWTDGSGNRRAAYIRAHRLRLATLAKAGVRSR